MVSISLSNAALLDANANAKALIVEQDFNSSVLAPFTKVFPAIKQLVQERKFTGGLLSHIVIPYSQKNEVAYLILVGMGKRKADKKFDFENYRRAVAKLMRIMEEIKTDSLALALPAASLFGVTPAYVAGQTAMVLDIASYHFDEFLTDPNRKIMADRRIVLLSDDQNKKEIEEGVKNGQIIATSVNKSRHWIDLPPSVLFPTDLANKAKAISREFGLKYTAFNEKEINQMGMGGLAAVSAGSDLDCMLVFMEYKCGKKNAPTVAFVGKGITFDSGGLSIKPANSMETMKEDMSGAAAVIAGMAAIAQLKPDINVIGVTPLSENLPSGKAAKPGDIIRFYNGKTAEIKNTDAEGRLILADALAYTVKHYKPDAIIDFATLTGSCAAALGPFYAGLMSNHDDLVKTIDASADRSGDKVWRLPLTDDYMPAIRTPVADISNIGSQTYMAGAITAALFLKHFVDDVPWAHLDIAGTAFDVPDLPFYRPHGATGYGVRLMVDIAMTWKV
jgi:leucyl aminopeptidase